MGYICEYAMHEGGRLLVYFHTRAPATLLIGRDVAISNGPSSQPYRAIAHILNFARTRALKDHVALKLGHGRQHGSQ